MKMYRLKVIFVFFLIGATIFSIFKYGVSLKEKEELESNLNRAEEQLAALEAEKQKLLDDLSRHQEENVILQESLRQAEAKITALNADFQRVHSAIDDLNSQISILKAENNALRDNETAVKTQLSRLSQENEDFKAKLSSLAGLKQAIRDLKQKMRTARRETAPAIKEVKPVPAIEGNRGYLVKNGKPTYSAALKIEVEPALLP